METRTNTVTIPPADDLVEVRKPTSLLIAQFFLFPLIIIAICVGIFVLFGYLVYEQRGPNDYLNDIQTGSGSTRWLAAVELSNQIPNARLKNPEFVQKVLTLYINSKDDDPRVRGFLAVTLGKLGDRQAVPALLQGLEDAETLKTGPDIAGPSSLPQVIHNAFNDPATLQGERREAQVQNQIYTLMALGLLGDNAAVPGALKHLRNEDASVRKVAAYVLGYLNDPAAVHDLQVALNDTQDDVRWNAAIALARLGDGAGAEMLLKLLDREALTSVPMTVEQKSELLVAAVQSLGQLKYGGARERIRQLSESDPDLGVRNASIEAMKKF